MKSSPLLVLLGLLVTTLVIPAEEPPSQDTDSVAVEPDSYRALGLLSEDKHSSLGRVEIKGKNPSVIYIPIIHDSALNKVSSTNMEGVKTILGNCKALSLHLHETYGVRNILLEGVSKTVADHYNKPETNWRKITWGKNATITYDTWGSILSSKRWNLAPAFDKKPLGPLTLLGRKYNDRIHGALKTAKGKGWFTTRKTFSENQAEFTKLINQACDGYNDKLAKILKEDPGLKREYAITNTSRNKIFLDNLAAADGPGIVLCGVGHYHDLLAQLNKSKTSYIVAVPAGMNWPPVEKDDEKIFSDMRALGCQLKKVKLGFGDGGAAEIKFPIK